MPGARIPGFFEVGEKQTINQPTPINGAPPSQRKTINEIAVDGLILFPPPALVQSELYNHPEGEMACWVTVAEMIIKHRNASARFKRPSFASFLPVDSAEKKLLYRGFVEGTLRNHGFDTVPGGKSAKFKWDITLTASSLSKLGPLLCIGDFGPPTLPSLPTDEKPGEVSLQRVIHTVAVFGAQGSTIYIRDPANGNIVTMDIESFNKKADDGVAWGENDLWFLTGGKRVIPRTLGA